ncbi:MAG TPA: carbohydrate ABC transporter permease [Brevefilum fermentans]|jgi:ABC-type glycerol-3-phosphate transport system permease component|uniref:Putative glycerol-3-phosphate transporter subunit membrane component of ABC superfamily (UgpE) n=1 Tax=Candidatus Brevifilum fermentans TaxID=1986204 RepID=A0A1Y6K2D8_9CHLR|nr:carbohydrate ABC transporter permease [Brevefilum fermentans]MDI9567190.1 carbohydrate ABC transporter permease [Chloroflexota bacterium]OQB84931.1 MAG: L-arabinose transport system permease protein AraQ [Chloroflexi bacterium ADurb.Bin120]SMX53821.1 Putative glycerol-3-phosphate transporter subunit; membrane component of ABC superfamily (ugpE) [Brevefilum fermentans]HOM66708.1 carbohydrate ABC transporter permease [Brevefilum fermentans]HPX95385.1 carbohydrate ABC transporter permease [Bre
MKLSNFRYRPLITIGQYIILIIAALIILYPIWSAFNISMMSDSEMGSYPPLQFPSGIRLNNIRRALTQAPLPRYLLNSVIQSLLVMMGQLITASLAAYAFAFIDFKWRNFFFLLFLSTMMIPWEATIIPNYLFVRKLGWTDTFQGLAVPFMATGFGTFLLRQFFLKIPPDLRDAATIDGCGSFRFLVTIVLPLARPALGTLAVYSFLQTYNQYLWPLLVTNNPSMRTVQIGIALLQDEERLMINIIMAGVIFILIPTLTLFIVSNRQLIRGLTAGAVKG